MPRRDGSPTKAEQATANMLAFHQSRIDSAGTPVEALNAGFAYLAAVVKRKAQDDPAKADEITKDAADYLIRQANTHHMTGTGGTR